MGTVYIDRKNLHVKLDGNALAFYMDGKREGMVPIGPIDKVVVIGHITIEAPVINRLADENISIIFLSGRRLRFHGMLHGRLHNNGLLRIKQYEKYTASNPNFSLIFSHGLVKRKIKGQSNLLKDSLTRRPELRLPITSAINTLDKIEENLYAIESEIKKGSGANPDDVMNSLRGYEGSAASAYFSAYTTLFPESLNFKNRNRRPPEDPVNAMLSLCYTLLHYEIVREIELAGLDPTIGFYHQFEYGRESLACDLVEIFRPEVDYFVWTIFREREFTSRDFSMDKERPGCYLKKGGRQRFYPLYEKWAEGVRPKFTEEVRLLCKTIMGEDDGLFG
ncbi:MAG: CRISPR-associated endonuclease Cas1 [Syntrophorhabdaceae bacterium]|nr:CRISPR-associated endonuclease Cas1 [Syntrophorhabdaceae bacterium]